MLKRIIVISLLFGLISSNFSYFFVNAGFDLNKKYIAENLCVNKNRPWLHCNGHCYFMKKIKQAEENQKKQERNDQKNSSQIGLPVLFGASLSAFEGTLLKKAYPNPKTSATIERSYAILQPPKFV